jgi:hypothetical protein
MELSKDTIREQLGGYNELPPNFETITESEFLWRFGQKHASGATEYRQVVVPSVGYGEGRDSLGSREMYCSMYMWVNHDFAGVGFITHYNGQATRSEIDAFFPQYFKFKVCDHDFETLEERMGWWKGRCRKCGYIHAIDSSD